MRNRGLVLLDEETKSGNIRAVDFVLLFDLEITNEATIWKFFDGDQTVAFADGFGGLGGCETED